MNWIYWPILSVLLLLMIYDIHHMIHHAPVQYHVGKGNIDEVKKYVKNGGNVNLKLMDDYSLLMISVENHRYGVARYLLESGADPNARNIRGETPLHKAVESGDLKGVSLLLKYNADPEAGGDTRSLSPLSLAISRGDLSVVKRLIKNGAEVERHRIEIDTSDEIRDFLGTRLDRQQ